MEPLAVEARPTVDLVVERKDSSRKVLPAQVYADRARTIRTSEISVKMVEGFLEELAKTGMWELSANRVGLNGRHIKEIMRLDDDFKEICNDAMSKFVDSVATEALRRAKEGWDEPVFSHKLGTQIGTIRKYDSNLMQTILKRFAPEYNEKFIGEMKVTGGVVVIPMAPPTTAAWEEQFNAPQPQPQPPQIENKDQ